MGTIKAGWRSIAALQTCFFMLICAFAGCSNDPSADMSGTDGSPQRTRPYDIRIDIIENNNENEFLSTKALHLEAVDESCRTLWEYTTGPCLKGELETVEFLGEFGDLAYVNEQAIYDPGQDGDTDFRNYLRALDIYTGKTVWDNEDFTGADVCFAYDDASGILYISGFYGPDCAAIDKEGKTLWICGHIDEETYMHPYKINLQDDAIEIVFDSFYDKYAGEMKEGPAYGYIGYDGGLFIG